MKKITHEEYRKDIETVVEKIKKTCKLYSGVYGIPRGGTYPASIIARMLNVEQVYDPEQIKPSTLIVDDLVDSGKTISAYPNNDKAVVYVKEGKADLCTFFGKNIGKEWVIFPDEGNSTVEDNCTRLLQYIGEDIAREGLLETPSRMRRAYDEIFAGYKQNPKDLFKTFTEGACKELVILKDCEFFSTCEHHFLPFFGKISIGYIPNGKVIGVSKLARLTDCFAKRLQIQERLVAQIADTLVEELNPSGVIVVCEAVHFCMKSRGVKKINASMITSAIRGVFEENPIARQEFLALIQK